MKIEDGAFVPCLELSGAKRQGGQVDNQTAVLPAVLLRRQRIRARVQKHRAKKRAEREAAKKALKEARRIARRARLVARRAALGLPMPGTSASRQKAYRNRLQAKGRMPYSRRELAEQAARKATEAAKYENQVPGNVIDTWFAPAMDPQTALVYVRKHVIPNQPEAAEKYIQQIAEQCRRHLLYVNRYTLGPGGVENARIFRALVWKQNAGRILGMSWDFARFQSANDLPKDAAARKLLFDASEATIGNGAAIAEEMQLGLV
jgi:hypothetical protein